MDRPTVLLVLGACAGIALAASGLAGSPDRPDAGLPTGTIARVNDAPIHADEFTRLLTSGSGDPADEKYRKAVLDRLIDEELLLQRAIALGLAREDRKIRGDLTNAVVASVLAGADDVQPTESELQAFYDANPALFSRPGQVRLRQVFCRVTRENEAAALALAQRAAERLRNGEEITEVRTEAGDSGLSPIPDRLMSATTLREYLGPTLFGSAAVLQPGQVSDPLRTGAGFHVLQMVERQPDSLLPFTDAKPQVQMELRRRRSEEELRKYVGQLRADARIEVAPQLPTPPTRGTR